MAKSTVLDQTEIRVVDLSDREVLALCDWQLDSEQNEEASGLLEEQREERLDEVGRVRLNELMQIYRRGMVRRSEALVVAVKRGLIPPLG